MAPPGIIFLYFGIHLIMEHKNLLTDIISCKLYSVNFTGKHHVTERVYTSDVLGNLHLIIFTVYRRKQVNLVQKGLFKLISTGVLLVIIITPETINLSGAYIICMSIWF